MKKVSILFALALLSACSSSRNPSFNNLIARMEVKEAIPGVCDNANVIAILPFPGNGQIEAEAPHSDEKLTEMLNAEVKFLKENPEYNDEGMVGLIVNCKGEMVRCKIDNKTQSPELDQQIVDVFSKMLEWQPGSVNGKAVDTSVLYSFKIENGMISL